MESPASDVQNGSQKAPVIRGARACTTCRAAKMKCVGSEDGHRPCQRCKRGGVECIFEKHRRGRKPGSKLSEASKMLRRLEKGLNTAKAKSRDTDDTDTQSPSARLAAGGGDQFRFPYAAGPSGSHPGPELPPLQLAFASPCAGRSTALDDTDDDDDQRKQGMYPECVIKDSQKKNSFFGTVLGPSGAACADIHRSTSTPTTLSERSHSFTLPAVQSPSPSASYPDPITLGYMDEEKAKQMFDMFFLRLNTFINLFDPELHTFKYVRRKCPFLFTTLLMAATKFWLPHLYRECYKLAQDLAVRAFADSCKKVEVVQAFACLMYWKEPDDTRTWTYIGYACRMSVELGLNRFVGAPPEHETDLQRLERRNRERTFLVLWVHDRSLSMQTGRHWMLREDALVRHSDTWHIAVPSGVIRPEDVILSAQVSLRRIAAETAEMFESQTPGVAHSDLDYEVPLRSCNTKLMQWETHWTHEMKQTNSTDFHIAFLQFFQSHVRLFLNSFGIQASLASPTHMTPSFAALNQCYKSAVDNLRIVTYEFAKMQMLYGQDSVTVMTAYSAVFLLRLLRSNNTNQDLHAEEIYLLISKTADAYDKAATMSSSSSSAAYHARFLRTLVVRDKMQSEQIRRDSVIDPVLQSGPKSLTKYRSTPCRPLIPPMPGPLPYTNGHSHDHVPQPLYSVTPSGSQILTSHPMHSPTFSQPLSAHSESTDNSMQTDVTTRNGGHQSACSSMIQSGSMMSAQQTADNDLAYWNSMFREMGNVPGAQLDSMGGDVGYGMYGQAAGSYPTYPIYQ